MESPQAKTDAEAPPKSIHIYCVYDIGTKKGYIGWTGLSVEAAWNRIIKNVEELKKADADPNYKVSDSIRKYPLYSDMAKATEKFKIRLLETVPQERLESEKQRWIQKLDTLYPKGYNMPSETPKDTSRKEPKEAPKPPSKARGKRSNTRTAAEAAASPGQIVVGVAKTSQGFECVQMGKSGIRFRLVIEGDQSQTDAMKQLALKYYTEFSLN